jgi:S-DNA-T family DNA segregation ATPase FtsK/SpoIIIE
MAFSKLNYLFRKLVSPFGSLLNNGRADSLPYITFGILYALTQWHRVTIDPPSRRWLEASSVYGWFIGFGLAAAYLSLVKSTKPVVLAAASGIAATAGWMLAATVYGANLQVTITGLLLTTILGIPFWKSKIWLAHDAKRVVRWEGAPPAEHTPAVTDPFAGIAWLKGAQWYGEAIATKTGSLRRLAIPDGASLYEFVSKRTAGMANLLRTDPEAIELVEVPKSGNLVDVLTHTTNVLEEVRGWPLLRANRPSILAPIPVGIRRDAQEISVKLLERHLLIAGEPGSGKSNLQAMFAAVAVKDPTAEVYFLDGKRTEFWAWRRHARAYVGDSAREGLEVLKTLQHELTVRQDIMRELKKRKFTETAGRIGPVVLLIDELAVYIRDKEYGKDFEKALQDLLNRGRSAGLIVIAATQFPSSNLMETDTRRGFTYRIAFRVGDTDGSEMILGRRDPDASKIDEEMRGAAYIGASGQPRLIRTYFITDDELNALVESADLPAVRNAEVTLEDDPELVFEISASEYDDAPRFPDGTRVPANRAALWDALDATPRTVSDLAARAGGMHDRLARESLRSWADAGHLTRIEAPRGFGGGERYHR